jgi:hypothetical protein
LSDAAGEDDAEQKRSIAYRIEAAKAAYGPEGENHDDDYGDPRDTKGNYASISYQLAERVERDETSGGHSGLCCLCRSRLPSVIQHASAWPVK